MLGLLCNLFELLLIRSLPLYGAESLALYVLQRRSLEHREQPQVSPELDWGCYYPEVAVAVALQSELSLACVSGNAASGVSRQIAGVR